MKRNGRENGSVIPEFVLVLIVLMPVIAGIVHVALVMHVRNTVTSAASDGARAGAARGANNSDAVARTQTLISAAIASHFPREVQAQVIDRDGVALMQVTVRAEVPAMGLTGPSTAVSSVAHAILQRTP